MNGREPLSMKKQKKCLSTMHCVACVTFLTLAHTRYSLLFVCARCFSPSIVYQRINTRAHTHRERERCVVKMQYFITFPHFLTVADVVKWPLKWVIHSRIHAACAFAHTHTRIFSFRQTDDWKHEHCTILLQIVELQLLAERKSRRELNALHSLLFSTF